MVKEIKQGPSSQAETGPPNIRFEQNQDKSDQLLTNNEDSSLPSEIRKRIEVEDGLLNTRTTVFLAVNALLGTAVGASHNPQLQKWTTGFAIALSILWFICSIQSWAVISQLTKYLMRVYGDVREEQMTSKAFVEKKIVQTALKPFRLLRSTNILAWWLPWLFILAWTILFIWGV
jgi:hypothetical protein